MRTHKAFHEFRCLLLFAFDRAHSHTETHSKYIYLRNIVLFVLHNWPLMAARASDYIKERNAATIRLLSNISIGIELKPHVSHPQSARRPQRTSTSSYNLTNSAVGGKKSAIAIR